MVKKLQKNSNYDQYDMDKDGVVSDEELITLELYKVPSIYLEVS